MHFYLGRLDQDLLPQELVTVLLYRIYFIRNAFHAPAINMNPSTVPVYQSHVGIMAGLDWKVKRL
jgi:hypothetical protein